MEHEASFVLIPCVSVTDPLPSFTFVRLPRYRIPGPMQFDMVNCEVSKDEIKLSRSANYGTFRHKCPYTWQIRIEKIVNQTQKMPLFGFLKESDMCEVLVEGHPHDSATRAGKARNVCINADLN